MVMVKNPHNLSRWHMRGESGFVEKNRKWTSTDHKESELALSLKEVGRLKE